MTDHVSRERMHEALDGLVASAEQDRIERHLHDCAACRSEYARLGEVVTALGALPRGATPPEGTWMAIAGRLDTTPRAVDAEEPVTVLRLPTSARPERRLRWSTAQLAGAAALVAMVSASAMWLAVGRDGVGAPRPGEVAVSSPGGAAARAVALGSGPYAETVLRLEQVLDEGRSVLAPETVLTIEESLRTLNAAIEDIETALGADPGSDLLARMLANHQRTKLGVLQRAAAAVQSQT